MAPIGLFDVESFPNEINHTLTAPFTTAPQFTTTPSLTTAPSFTAVPQFNVSTTQDHSESTNNVSVIFHIIYIVLGVLGTFGNLLVIIVVTLDRQLRNTSNILMLSLAVADLLYVLCTVFSGPEKTFHVWSLGDVDMKIFTFLKFTCNCVSVFTLALIAGDRYLAVVHALRSIAWRTQRKAWIAIATSWTVALCGNTPSLIYYFVENHTYDGRNRSRVHDSTSFRTVYHASFFCTSSVISLGSSAVLYGLLVRKLLCSRVPGEGSESAESLKVKKRVTVMVIAVTATFAVCWMPNYIIYWLHYSRTIDLKNEIIRTISRTCNSLIMLNSSIHPILFSFMSKTFCHSVWRHLCCFLTSRRRAR